MVNKNHVLFLFILLVIGCSGDIRDAQSIIDESIDFHGGGLFENSIFEFDFRGRHYIFERDHGGFKYSRIFDDSLGTYHDVLTNDSFVRLLNDEEQDISSDWKRRYSNSVNSVAYFAFLPFGLNDPAVNKSLLGTEEINGEIYYKIKVTFDQQGGGEDYEDVFVYWIHKERFSMDYFGYYYKNDGGGIRFREAINRHKIDGITLSDYKNFKGPDGYDDVANLASMFQNDQLEFLSEIKLENLRIRRYK